MQTDLERNRDLKTGYDNTGGQTGLSPEEAASLDIPVPFHPEESAAAPATMPIDPVAAVETFAIRVATNLDSDYGDWMREANVAWIELDDVIGGSSAAVDRKMQLMQEIIQFNPNGRPIETCRAALVLARDIRRELGISGDLDLHRFGIGWTEPETAEIELEEASPYPNHHMPTNRTYPHRKEPRNANS